MKTAFKQELMNEIKTLPSNLTEDVLNFVCFVKLRNAIDPKQSYFWTKKWQSLEKEADEDIKKGRLNTYSSVKELKLKLGN